MGKDRHREQRVVGSNDREKNVWACAYTQARGNEWGAGAVRLSPRYLPDPGITFLVRFTTVKEFPTLTTFRLHCESYVCQSGSYLSEVVRFVVDK